MSNDYRDEPRICVDCGRNYVFTAGEQRTHERLGFTNPPKRCQPCRATRRATRPASYMGVNDERIEWRDGMDAQKEYAAGHGRGQRVGTADTRAITIAKGLIDLRKKALDTGVMCECCSKDRLPATVISYIGGRFLHRCAYCADWGRTERTAPLTTSTSAPASTRLTAERERLARAERDQYIVPPSQRPQAPKPNPAGYTKLEPVVKWGTD